MPGARQLPLISEYYARLGQKGMFIWQNCCQISCYQQAVFLPKSQNPTERNFESVAFGHRRPYTALALKKACNWAWSGALGCAPGRVQARAPAAQA